MKTLDEKIKLGTLLRSVDMDGEPKDEDMSIECSFSSEEPVDRCFGIEVLDHSPSSVDLSRLNNAAPLLLNHNWDDQIGVVEKAEIANRKGKAKIRFSKSAKAREIWQDVKDKIRRNMSVGYRITKIIEETDKVKDETICRVTGWLPMELSIVGIPADNSVGIGRKQDVSETEAVITRMVKEEKPKITIKKEEPKMTPEEKAEMLKSEQGRAKELLAIGKRHKLEDEAAQAISEGTSVADFSRNVLDKLAERQAKIQQAPQVLSEKEAKRFSYIRAINALAFPNDPKAQEAAAYEREVSSAAAKAYGTTARGILLPNEVLKRSFDTTAGASVIQTSVLTGSLIETLDALAVVMSLNPTVLRGVVGNLQIPRQTARATSEDVAEDGNATASNLTLDDIDLTPHTLTANSYITRRMLLQTSLDCENMVKNDIAESLALKLDYNALRATGAGNAPTGILSTTGIGAIAWGGADTPSFGKFVDLETEIAKDNVRIDSMNYLMNAVFAGKCKQTAKVSSTDSFMLMEKGEINGYPVKVTNQMPTSTALFGKFSDLILAFWSGIDLVVDPYTQSKKGGIVVTGHYDYDIGVRHPESFAKATNTGS